MTRSTALALVLSLVACRSRPAAVGDGPSASSAPAPTDRVDASAGPAADPDVDAGPRATEAEVDAHLAAKSADVTPPIEAALMAQVATCAMKDGDVDDECPAWKRWRDGENKGFRSDKAGSKAVAAAFLRHPSPAARCLASHVLGQPWDPDRYDALIEAARRETDPQVVECIVRRGHGAWLVDPTAASATFLVAMTEHASERVRKEAVARILHRGELGKGRPEVFEAVLKRLDADPSMAVRSDACEHLYDTEDERALPAFARYLDGKAPPELAAACFTGVVNAWARSPRHDKPSRRAYEITLEVLERTPRTATMPPPDGTGIIGVGSAKVERGDRDDEAWARAVRPWFDVARVRGALEKVALDGDAHDSARYHAARSLKDLGAPPAVFARITKACEKQGASCTESSLGLWLRDPT